MTCRECESLLGGDDLAAAVEEHLQSCAACQALAEELPENATALSAMRHDHVGEVPNVRRIGRPARAPLWIAAAAAAVLLLAIGTLRPHHSTAPVAAPAPLVVASLPLPSAQPQLPALAHPVRRATPKPAPAPEETMFVKMLTPDPEVVIYWIVEPKERAE